MSSVESRAWGLVCAALAIACVRTHARGFATTVLAASLVSWVAPQSARYIGTGGKGTTPAASARSSTNEFPSTLNPRKQAVPPEAAPIEEVPTVRRATPPHAMLPTVRPPRAFYVQKRLQFQMDLQRTRNGARQT